MVSQPSAIKRTGVIGLGAMGLQMARHIAGAGLDVSGFDIDPGARQRACDAGVQPCRSAVDVARRAELVIVMVQTDEQVEQVMVELLDGLARETIVCIASSISPDLCRRLADEAAVRGIDVLDTPVVLGQEAANHGTLTTYVGGQESALARARPVLATFCRNVLYLGGPGSGQIAKTINNLLLWACMTANFEALTLAKTLKVDVPRLVEALGHGSGANWSLSRWGKSTGKWSEKDMDVALELAQAAKVPLPLYGLVDQLVKHLNQDRMKALLS